MQQENKEEEKKECTHTARKEEKKNQKKFCIHTMKNTVEKKKKKRKQDQKHFYFLPIYTNTKATSYTTLKKTTQQTRKKKIYSGRTKIKNRPIFSQL